MVEKPYIPLQHFRNYDPYRLALFITCSKVNFISASQIETWLSNRNTLDLFKHSLSEVLQKYDISIDVDAICIDNWLKYIAHNKGIIHDILDWKKGRCMEFKIGSDDLYLEKHYELSVCDIPMCF